MRVLAAVPAYPPESRIGAWLATHRCLAHLAARGHRVDVLLLNRPRSKVYELDGVHIGPVGTTLKLAVAVADVVISHCGDDAKAAVLARRWSKPSVRMYHGGQKPVVDGDLVVYNSHTSQQASDWAGPSIVVHPSVDPAQFRTTAGDRVTLVNLSEAKGARLFDRLARTMPERQFLGVKGGYGVQLNVSCDNIDVISTTPDMRDDVYARTRILLMPSEAETWGMVGVEAMCSGIPVIAHPTPGLLESLGSAGIFVDRSNGQKWIDAIGALDDPTVYREAFAKAVERSNELAALDGRDIFCDAIEALSEFGSGGHGRREPAASSSHDLPLSGDSVSDGRSAELGECISEITR